jgi:type IV pilus assembly protein PilB
MNKEKAMSAQDPKLVARALMEKGRRKIGRCLVDRELITEHQLNEALKQQENSGDLLGIILVRQGYLSEENLAQTLSESLGLPFVDLDKAEIDEGALAAIPHAIMRRHNLLPFGLEKNRLLLACERPPGGQILGNLRRIAGRQIVLHIAVGSILKEVLSNSLEGERGLSVSRTLSRGVTNPLLAGEADQTGVDPDASVVGLLDEFILRAMRQRASDIHIETAKDRLRLRFRIDGLLRDVESHPLDIGSPLISRVKVLSNLNIAEKRAPQDGGFSLEKEDIAVDIRVSVLPTIYGEKVVLRLLTAGRERIDFESLGMEPHTREAFLSALKRPHGLILVSGPTGSGKSTALYAALLSLRSPEVNITTVEDPVEYKIDGISQVQVNQARNVNFANALRSILRQDPDIIMVGEIRDRETADIAIQASLTGHLVLATIHTNDAPSALTRLIEIGCEPYLVSSAVVGVMAQRLVRVICDSCGESYQPSLDEFKRFGYQDVVPGVQWARGTGCRRCDHSGYRGRTGIFEYMKMDKTVRQEVIRHAPAEVIREAALSQGMRTLQEDGLLKVNRRQTTPEEVLRVTILE